jgi:hypothetical protein
MAPKARDQAAKCGWMMMAVKWERMLADHLYMATSARAMSPSGSRRYGEPEEKKG